MKTHIHANYTKKREKGSDLTKKEFTGLIGCKACKKRCAGCGMPFNISNALIDEGKYCSIFCESQHVQNPYKILTRKK